MCGGVLWAVGYDCDGLREGSGLRDSGIILVCIGAEALREG